MVKRSTKIITTILVLFGLFISTASIVSAADPTVSIDPTEPTAKSSVTFTAEFTDSDISNVKLIVQECNPTICYADKLETSMTEMSANNFEGSVTLTHDDGTYIKYWVEYKVGDVESSHGPIEKNLKTSNGNNGSNDSPGFEIILVFISVIMIMFILKRKRYK